MSLPDLEVYTNIDSYDVERYVDENFDTVLEYLDITDKSSNIEKLLKNFEDKHYKLTKIANGISNEVLTKEEIKDLVNSYERLKDDILGELK